MSKQFPHPFKDMAARFRAYRKALPKVASGMAKKHFEDNFRKQGAYTGSGGTLEKWEPRKDNRRSAGRAILVKTGRLRRGLRTAPSYNHARVVNNVPYAAIHNRGGALKGQARAWSTNLRSGLLRRRQSNTPASMPARPFMVGTEPLYNEISEEVMLGLEEVFKGASSQ
jgi:phage gpG-like protein